MRRILPRLFVLICLIAAPAIAQITFLFDYKDVTGSSGVGFDDATLGATRRSSLVAGANLLGSIFSTSGARTVKIEVGTSETDGSGSLASAGGLTFVGPGYNKNLPMEVIQSGLHSGQAKHGSMTWDFGYTWDLDDSIASGAFDFKRVAMHEMGHIFGFSSYISSNGNGFDDAANSTTYSYFDQFLTNSSGTQLVDSGGTYNGGTILTDGASSDVYFNGANAMAANGGQLIHMYSPETYTVGSSLSHLDTDFFGSTDYIMTHAVSSGSSVREFTAIELGIWKDLGYSLSAVPEPASATLLLGGFFLFVTMSRRRGLRVR